MNQVVTMSPRIFVLESDDNVRPLLKQNLQNWGYQVTMAFNEADAIERTQAGCKRFDLILLDQNGQSIDELVTIGQQIRQRTDFDSRVPIVIMAEKYGADFEGKNIQVGSNEYVTYLEDGEQLKRILHQLVSLQRVQGKIR